MGAVNTTYTFTATDTITSAKMNNIIDETVMTSDAVLGGSGGSGGLDIASGKLSISANAINSSRLAASSVTTNAIADEAVTPVKLSPFGPAWSNGLSNFNIQQNVLELATGITSNSGCFIDFHSVHPLTDYETRIVRDTGVDGWFAIQNQGAGRISFSSAGGFQFADAHMPNPVGNAPLFGVRAWVNFNGRTTNGTCTIRSSGNVSSVVRTNTGKYTVNFTTPMQGLNYMAICNSGSAGTPRFACADRTSITTSSIKIEIDNLSGGPADLSENNVMIME
jgi:hypothetical protein